MERGFAFAVALAIESRGVGVSNPLPPVVPVEVRPDPRRSLCSG
jgi:hypothetical protein